MKLFSKADLEGIKLFPELQVEHHHLPQTQLPHAKEDCINVCYDLQANAFSQQKVVPLLMLLDGFLHPKLLLCF